MIDGGDDVIQTELQMGQKQIVFGDTYVISSKSVVDLRLGYLRWNYNRIPTNFGLSAHVASNTQTQDVGGSFVVTVPDNVGGCHAQLMSTVDCLQVNGNSANLIAHVTQASGNLAYLVGKKISVPVVDSIPDRIDDFVATGDVQCPFTGTANTPVTHGNIVVRDAQ